MTDRHALTVGGIAVGTIRAGSGLRGTNWAVVAGCADAARWALQDLATGAVETSVTIATGSDETFATTVLATVASQAGSRVV